ncbi:MAG: penicillin-binding protein [Deltaproteobacteria bacterium]|nr:penicillin-binding protein [Deltaproteobacteria bacterium]
MELLNLFKVLPILILTCLWPQRILANDSFLGANEHAQLNYSIEGHPFIFAESFNRKYIADSRYIVNIGEKKVVLTLDVEMQQNAEQLLRVHDVPWGALVALDPKTGKVLALAGYSANEGGVSDIAVRSGFPAASLFKLITASAAIEMAGLNSDDEIKFRGGNYTLSRGNYLPSDKGDRRSMTLATALGKSINPVFGRIALVELERGTLEAYAQSYGFNNEISFDVPTEISRFELADDDFERARTGAGFGNVTISPLHAALITGAIANQGHMMKPYLIDKVYDVQGNNEYEAAESIMKNSVLPSTASELLEAMKSTVTDGTAKRQFIALRNTRWGDIEVAAKTGTLSGTNPKGLYLWFVAAAPVDDPKIAIAALVIDPGTARIKGSALGRKFLENFFKSAMWEMEE